MNNAVTSNEAILAISKDIIVKQGMQALNMRSVAEKCNVSVGSIYNYFPSKTELMIAVTQNIWEDIFSMRNKKYTKSKRFVDCIVWIFESVNEGASDYPMFFTVHSLNFSQLSTEKGKGREVMQHYFEHIKKIMLADLEEDIAVRRNAFTKEFTKTQFIDFVFANLMTLFLQNEKSCDYLVKIVRRIIY